jgi:hypothetical protein
MNGRSGFTLSVTFAELITSSVTKDEHRGPPGKSSKKISPRYRYDIVLLLASYFLNWVLNCRGGQ